MTRSKQSKTRAGEKVIVSLDERRATLAWKGKHRDVVASIWDRPFRSLKSLVERDQE